MKKLTITLLGIFSIALVFAQNNQTATTNDRARILLATGQKIVIESNVTSETSLGMGMEFSLSSTIENSLEVKNNSARQSTISNTLTKIKMNIDGMGQAINYDSEKTDGATPEITKTFEDKLNKPTDIIIDNATGKLIAGEKKEKKPGLDNEETDNPMQGMLAMFTENSDDDVVAGAFELIPVGKSVGNSWIDSTMTKDMKSIRIYTLKSVTDNEAVIQLDAVMTSKNKLDIQGMELEFDMATKSTGDIVTDINSGLVKKRTTQSEITGSFQLMGQDMPISGKTNTTSIYK